MATETFTVNNIHSCKKQETNEMPTDGGTLKNKLWYIHKLQN